jgi:hypothetical protein
MKVVHVFSIGNSKKQTGLVGVRPPPRLSLLEKLNLLRLRKSTNPGRLSTEFHCWSKLTKHARCEVGVWSTEHSMLNVNVKPKLRVSAINIAQPSWSYCVHTSCCYMILQLKLSTFPCFELSLELSKPITLHFCRVSVKPWTPFTLYGYICQQLMRCMI